MELEVSLPISSEIAVAESPPARRPSAVREAPPHAISPSARARLRAMFEAHYPFLWRVLRRLGVPPQTLDDAAQQVFYVATRKIDDIAAESERAFLLSTAMRVAAEARRARATAREQPRDQLDVEAHPSPNPEQLTDRKHALELLDRVLESLPFDLRTVFVLFEIEALSTHEIASVLEIPRGTVASRLRRAREEFDAIVARVRAKAAFRGGKP